MGYCYGTNPLTGRRQLACDGCSTIGGVRKRTCPHKVIGDSSRSSNGQRLGPIPYCYPAALCPACHAKHKATLHENCKAAAAKSQAEDDAIQARLDGGDLIVISASADWREDVPKGMTAVTFGGAGGAPTWEDYLMPTTTYHAGQSAGWKFLSDYTEPERINA